MSDKLDDWISKLRFQSHEQFYEDICLRAIVESYKYITHTVDDENKIRDRLYWDLTERNPITKDLLEVYFLEINFERWNMVSEIEKRRVDLTFCLFGVGRFEVECKCFSGKQTVKGKYLTDGLIRFIELKYAKGDYLAGMLGFVTGGDINSIFSSNMKNAASFHPSNPKQKVKTPIDTNWQHGFVSFHERVNKEDIQIYHLLLEFNEK